ncbi:hypothetical protein HMN09_00482700 [Mycena chlorophos]|uniref:Uncharacterized protein n=1 Tax=Mycena chlorophos TaxID=658473 RepID=A0A8H6TKQ3_MYCCL|nr:hypothetical protein HMN09_00482700 [Mycena chlorophos]
MLCDAQSQHIRTPVPDAYRDDPADEDLVGIDGTRMYEGRIVDWENVVLAVTVVVYELRASTCGLAEGPFCRTTALGPGTDILPAITSAPTRTHAAHARPGCRTPPWALQHPPTRLRDERDAQSSRAFPSSFGLSVLTEDARRDGSGDCVAALSSPYAMQDKEARLDEHDSQRARCERTSAIAAMDGVSVP